MPSMRGMSTSSSTRSAADSCRASNASLPSAPFEVRFGWSRGYAIWLSGVPLTRSSSLQLYAPGWKEGYYSSNGSRTVVKQQGDALVLNHVATKLEFRATETVRAIDPNHL